MGMYDVPAIIDYILDKTGQTSLLYVGYSQGTTAFFVMASERPEYNAKVRVMVCLAPIAFLSNQRSPLLKCVVPLHIVMKVSSHPRCSNDPVAFVLYLLLACFSGRSRTATSISGSRVTSSRRTPSVRSWETHRSRFPTPSAPDGSTSSLASAAINSTSPCCPLYSDTFRLELRPNKLFTTVKPSNLVIIL